MTAPTQATTADELRELGVGDPETTDRTLSRDVVFHVLQNERRRLVLKYLQDREGRVRMRDVAEQVAAWEHDTTVERLTSKQRQRVYIPLYQNHLPTLDDEGIIDYNQSRGIVERNPLADQLEPYLGEPFQTEETDEEPGRSDERWERYYLGASLLGTALVSAKAFGMGALASFSGTFVGAVVLLAFSLLTVAQVTGPHLSDLR